MTDNETRIVQMFDSYVKRSLRNYATTWKRAFVERMMREVPLDSIGGGGFAVEDDYPTDTQWIESLGTSFIIRSDFAYRHLMSLSDKQRAVFLYHYWNGDSFKSIAGRLGVSTKTVRKLRDSAIAQIVRSHEDI